MVMIIENFFVWFYFADLLSKKIISCIVAWFRETGEHLGLVQMQRVH